MNAPEPPDPAGQRARWCQAALFAGGLTLLQALPWLLLLGQRISIVAFATESVGYRYFHSYRLLHGDKSAIWEAQGQTLGVFHHVLNAALTGAGVEDLQRRLDLFGYGTLAFSSFLWGVTCLLIARTAGAGWRDRWLLALTGLFGFYGSFWGRAAAILPDYYTWEVIATVACAGLFLRHVREPERGPTPSRAIRLGVLAGLMAGIKFTLLPAAALPLLPWLMHSGSRSRFRLAAGLWFAALVATTGLLLAAYYLGDFGQLGRAYQAWKSFVAAPGAEPGFIARLLNPFAPIAKPWDDHQFAPFIFLLWLVALSALVANARRYAARRSSLVLLGAFVTFTSVLHVYAVIRRPAETTLFESGLFLAVSGAVLLVAAAPASRRLVLSWSLVLAGWCVASMVRYAPTAPTYAQLRETSTTTWGLHHRLNAAGLPVLVVFPDNRYVANTVEECLMKGFSDTPTWNITAGQVLLDRVAPGRRFAQQLDSLPPGHVVMWTEIPGQPAVTDLLPVLKRCETGAESWPLPRDYVGRRVARVALTSPPPSAAGSPP